jgi:hypothetical protein
VLPAIVKRPAARIAAVAAVVIAAVVVVLVLTLSSGSSHSGRQMESILQDDQFLLNEPAQSVARTLASLHALGVDRVRVTVLWAAIAPRPHSRRRPHNFDAADPSAYPAAGWAPYDRLVKLAGAHDVAVDFTVTAPGPLWAMGKGAPSAKFATHFKPSAPEFGRFVEAVGRRYSGNFKRSGSAKLPRVSFWTIWNEPNQPGWLAPQWRSVGSARVQNAPRLYRRFVRAAWTGLQASGHTPASDTILIGELAPEGSETTTAESPIPPMRFLRALYCVGRNGKPLHGRLALRTGCPEGGSTRAFVKANPGLFSATGFAHHPYAFFLPPTTPMSDPNFVPLANISRLEKGLDQIFSVYGVHRQLPVYITEYGYETNPPNPFRGVSPVKQAAYIDQAQYLAWRDPRVRTMAQFLFVDSAPNPRFPKGSNGYWSTFQTGLLYLNGQPKPSLTAYALPIDVPNKKFKAGAKVFVWGMVRAAPNGTSQHVGLQWRRRNGSWNTVTHLSTGNPDGFLTATVKLPGTGSLRLAWQSPSGRTLYSRLVSVRQQG